MRAVTVPGLNSQQQLEVVLEGGIRCHRLGLWRKYALFMYIAAIMSAENENFGVAHALVRVMVFWILFISDILCWFRCAMFLMSVEFQQAWMGNLQSS